MAARAACAGCGLGYHGNIDALLRDPASKKLILQPENNDFVTRANNKDTKLDAQGLAVPPSPHWWWDGEMIGDWHDSLVRAAFLTGDRRARERADKFVAAILKSQDEDGYIGIYPKGFRFHFSGPDGELWTQRCALLPLLAYYEFTGREDVLRAVERAVKLTIRQYGAAPNYFDNPGQIGNGVAHGLMYLDVLEWLYRLKHDGEYRRAAIQLYSAYNASTRVANQDARLERLIDPKSKLGRPWTGHHGLPAHPAALVLPDGRARLPAGLGELFRQGGARPRRGRLAAIRPEGGDQDGRPGARLAV